MISAFYEWQRRAFAVLIKSAGDRSRIDAMELAELFAGKVEGVDITRNPEPEPLAEDEQPIDRLLPYVVRDFRDAGTGGSWDRCRDYDPHVYGWPRDKSRGQSLGVREWGRIDTIVLHTAAAKLHADRFLGVPCHLAVAERGGVVLCHELTAYLAHGHRLNSFSIGVEISGERSISVSQIEPARAVVRYVAAELRRKHAELGDEKPIKISPHRHGHSSRVNDCDLEIWRAVAEWAIDELGLEVGDVVGSGKPIPPGWWTPGREEVQP